MATYNYVESVERKVDKIRSKALRLAQAVDPKVGHIVDNRTTDDYCEMIWDYPGAWYASFRLPKGFKTEEQLISQLVRDTLAFYAKKGKR